MTNPEDIDAKDIVHLPELYITKEQLKQIYEKHFGSNDIFTREELVSQPDTMEEIRKIVHNVLTEKVNPWAVCTASTGRSDKTKYERCVMDVKKKEGMHEEVEVTKYKNKLIIKKSVDNMSTEKIAITKKFIALCLKELKIAEPCTVYFTGKRGGPIKTTATFFPDNNEIWIYCKNRNMLGDVLRSTAHEIRHLRQNLDGVITDKSGLDGSEHENEANSFSGLMIRKFGKIEPGIYL